MEMEILVVEYDFIHFDSFHGQNKDKVKLIDLWAIAHTAYQFYDLLKTDLNTKIQIAICTYLLMGLS